jgi:hypothetical protein
MFFPQFRPTSKVWVYTADRNLTDSEQEIIEKELKPFISSWAAHGNELYGGSIIHENRFVILAVDESSVTASGCSIDTSVKFMKELGNKIGVNFFDRLNLIVEHDGNLKRVHISDLKEYLDWNVFNPMVSNLKELRENWCVPVSASPFV